MISNIYSVSDLPAPKIKAIYNKENFTITPRHAVGDHQPLLSSEFWTSYECKPVFSGPPKGTAL